MLEKSSETNITFCKVNTDNILKKSFSIPTSSSDSDYGSEGWNVPLFKNPQVSLGATKSYSEPSVILYLSVSN